LISIFFFVLTYLLFIKLFFIFFSPLGEAIEKMLQEKKISSKINYEVLKNLNNQQQNNQDLSITNTSELDTISFKKPLVQIIHYYYYYNCDQID